MLREEYRACIDACMQCAEVCEECATACLQERDVTPMAECIRLDRDCADICRLAAAFMSRESLFSRNLCRLCAEVCEDCATECARHDTEHCRRCAAVCHTCAEECEKMAGAMGMD